MHSAVHKFLLCRYLLTFAQSYYSGFKLLLVHEQDVFKSHVNLAFRHHSKQELLITAGAHTVIHIIYYSWCAYSNTQLFIFWIATDLCTILSLWFHKEEFYYYYSGQQDIAFYFLLGTIPLCPTNLLVVLVLTHRIWVIKFERHLMKGSRQSANELLHLSVIVHELVQLGHNVEEWMAHLRNPCH